MRPNRLWIAICLAGICWGMGAGAQETGGAASGSGGSGQSSGAGSESSGSGAKSSEAEESGTKPSGAKPGKKPAEGVPAEEKPGEPGTSGGTGTPKPGGSVDPFVPTTPKPENTNATGASSAFGPPAPPAAPGAEKPGQTEGTEGSAAGSSSAFGPNDTTATQQAPPTFTLPGFFGGPATTYTGGQGRLARPRFRYNVTVSQGYDDNVLQTPDDQQRAPDQQVLVDPGTPDTVTFVPVTTTTYEQAFAGPLIYFRPVTTTTFQPVVTRGRDPVIRTIRSPEPQERTGSLISRIGLRVDGQQVTRRSLFTFDFRGSADHYWDRPGTDGKDDYTGSVTLAYLYNLTPRWQASVTANVAYISQPDFTRINTPDRLGAGDLVNALARLNMSYRVSPRITTTFSAGQNAIIYVESGNSSTGAVNGNSYETTFSGEAKYLWKPRYTLLAEFRHVLINYPETPSVNATTELLLIGAEMKLSSRLSATIRLGDAIRIFDESGNTANAPYAESTVTYRISPTSSLQWVSRFGFEEPPSETSEVLTYRTTLNYSKAFTPRLSLSAGITGVSRNTSFKGVGGGEFSDQVVDANIALEYHFTRQLSLNATFSYTQTFSTTGDRDYDRSRIFLGAEYQF